MLLAIIAGVCVLSLPWSLAQYDKTHAGAVGVDIERPPSLSPFFPMGTDRLERNLFWRVTLGGVISLGIGLAAAALSVTIGVVYGAAAGLIGGRVDSFMMRIVDVLYGLPYILLVVLLNIALSGPMERVVAAAGLPQSAASVVTLLLAIGGISWLTMSRVIRGQVLSLREQPFIEAARATGVSTPRILRVHLLPNLVGPIVVYATLTVPQAILQESFLSFLGIGVKPPIPSWGNLASDGLPQVYSVGDPGNPFRWWLIVFPCALLGVTLMSLNFMGDALRDYFDPTTRQR